MKKNILIPILFGLVIFLSSCSKSVLFGSENCIARIEKVSASLEAYMEEPSVANCRNYVEALRSYLKSDACFGNIYFKEYQEALAELEDDECK
ncbi:MAG: hypothetical protein HKN76_06325 [Saprospiraceae bacterium]|nr:hypothetical protein [Saprospiraceae bacterium]